MENNTGVNTFMKSRATGSCVKAGYTLYADNFKKTLRLSWPAALLYSVVFSILGTIGVVRFPALMTRMLANISRPEPYGIDGSTALLATVALLIVIGALFETVFYSYGMSLLRTHSRQGDMTITAKRFFIDRHTAWRTIKATASSLLLCAIPAILFVVFFHSRLRLMLMEAGAHIPTLVVTAVAAIAVILLLLPICYTSFKYIMSDGIRYWPLLRSDYATGLRHLPIITAVMFVNIVTIAVASYVILQPAVVLLLANTQANLGTVYGDPLGMPGHIVPMTVLVFLIAGFLQAYIRLSALFTAYYMYGSIEAQEAERKQYNTLNVEH